MAGVILSLRREENGHIRSVEPPTRYDTWERGRAGAIGMKKGASAVAIFKVQDAFGGGAVVFGPNYPGIEIAFDPQRSGAHGQAYALSAPLASDPEIDTAVDKLIGELQELRGAAKRALQDYRKRAAAGKGMTSP